MELPSELSRGVADWKGDVARQWVKTLPGTLARAEERWGISIGAPFEPGGYTSYVAPATAEDGDQAVYKCTIPHAEAIGEADALSAYCGDGAVQLIESKPATYELLVDRCVPGVDLWSIADDTHRLEIAAALMRRLWINVEEHRFATLDSVMPQWADITERRLVISELPWSPDPIERGIDLLRGLPGTASDRVLVHGDLHPGNILAAQREPWLVIDPKPMVGDPAYDPIQLLTQQGGRISETPPPDDVERRLEHLATLVGLDAQRIGLWGIARCAEWSMWSLGHGVVIDAAIAYTWARTLDAIIAE